MTLKETAAAIAIATNRAGNPFKKDRIMNELKIYWSDLTSEAKERLKILEPYAREPLATLEIVPNSNAPRTVEESDRALEIGNAMENATLCACGQKPAQDRYNSPDFGYNVVCRKCGISGGVEISIGNAVRAWNNKI